MPRLQSLLGLIVLLGVCWAISENRRRINLRTVATGVALQLALCFALLRFPPFRDAFHWLNAGVRALSAATEAGTAMVFGFLGGGPLPYAETSPGASYVLACRGLPLVLVVSALSSLLFYWRVLPALVRGLSWLLTKSLNVGGCEALATAANIFVGMVESPLLVRPYLNRLGRSEMFAVMTAGMATIAGTVMVLYAQILGAALPEAMGHILVASIVSAPAALTVAKIMIPQIGEPVSGRVEIEEEAQGAMDAITRGTGRGLALLLNIVAMLIVCVALVQLVNSVLGLLPAIGEQPVTLQRLLGWALAPVAWLLGLPWAEAKVGGSLIGIKTVLNELLAYLELSQLPAGALSERSRTIMVYALCGFANFGSLGIMIGGMGAMVDEEKRLLIVRLGMRSILSGTIAACMTGAVVGIVW